MKSYFLFILLPLFLLSFVSGVAHAQYPCQITCDKEMPVCSQEPVTLSVPNNHLYHFSWTPGNYTTNTITVKPFVTTTYQVYVTDTAGFEICDDSFTVEVLPRFNTEMQQLRLTCSNSEADNGRTAQVKVNVTNGQEPLSYYWEEGFGLGQWSQLNPLHMVPNDPSAVIGLKANKWYRVEVTDGRSCVQHDSIFTHAYPTADIEISCNLGDSVYLQNPTVSFSFENYSDNVFIDYFFWTLPDGQTSVNPIPTYTFTEPNDYTVSLTIFDDFGCDTSYSKTIKVVPYGLNENNLFSVDISPNPTNGNVIIKTDNHFQISIFNAYGQLICEDTANSNNYGFDFGKYCDGIYFLQIKTSKGIINKKVIVVK